MKFIVGTKVNMTEYFAEDGKMHAATIVQAGPIVVTQIKTSDKDGYSAVQVGFGFRKEKNLSQALMGHFAGKGTFAEVREFRVAPEQTGGMNAGDTIATDVFAAGDVVTVSGTSKAAVNLTIRLRRDAVMQVAAMTTTVQSASRYCAGGRHAGCKSLVPPGLCTCGCHRRH